jgi:hypothetical protein
MPLCKFDSAFQLVRGDITQAQEQVSKPHVSKIAFLYRDLSVYTGKAFAFDSDKEQRKLDKFLSWRE